MDAYETAVANGFQGNRNEWFDTYHTGWQSAVAAGYSGTLQDWLDLNAAGFASSSSTFDLMADPNFQQIRAIELLGL